MRPSAGKVMGSFEWFLLIILSGTTLMMIPIALLVDRPWRLPAPGIRTLGALLALGLLSTAVAYVIYFCLLATAGATNLLLVTFLIPVSTLVLGMTFLGEKLDPRHFLGMGMIGAGLVFTRGRLLPFLQAQFLRSSLKQRAGDDCII